MRRRTWAPVVAVVAAVAVIAVAMGSLSRDGSSDAADTYRPLRPTSASGWTRVGQQAPSTWTPAASRLPHQAGSLGAVRVADDLAPPTNRWYSGMFLGAEPQPVFAMPLAVQADDTGLAVGLPRVSASERTITAPFAPELRLGLPADGFSATRADPVSATATYTSGGTPVGELDLAEGWPYAGYTALGTQDVTVPEATQPRDGGRWLTTVAGDTTYGLAVAGSDGSRRAVAPTGGVLSLEKGETLLVFAARDERTLTELARGAVPVHGTSTSYAVRGGQARTRIDYRTPAGTSTVLAAMPHQRLERPDVVGRVDSLYGPLRLVRSSDLVSRVPATAPDAGLDVTGLRRPAR